MAAAVLLLAAAAAVARGTPATTIPRGAPGIVTVVATGARHATLQSAVDALPPTGGELTLSPGVYREKVSISGSAVRLRGIGRRPEDVIIVWNDASIIVGGTLKSATVIVSGDDFRADNLTIQNDYSLHFETGSQAVALNVTGDRAVFSRVRLLGAQDTLYAGNHCGDRECPSSRQYFRDCYIEGHIDFIFGESNAFFERCRIHAIANDEVMLTAHRRSNPGWERAFVFDRCRITAAPGVGKLWLGRPWRDYARVIFLNTRIDAALEPAGWREWTPGQTNRLTTAYYAEYRSRGRGARSARRDPNAHALSAAQAARWSMRELFGDWRPD